VEAVESAAPLGLVAVDGSDRRLPQNPADLTFRRSDVHHACGVLNPHKRRNFVNRARKELQFDESLQEEFLS
jgi:hypothetical protein